MKRLWPYFNGYSSAKRFIHLVVRSRSVLEAVTVIELWVRIIRTMWRGRGLNISGYDVKSAAGDLVHEQCNSVLGIFIAIMPHTYRQRDVQTNTFNILYWIYISIILLDSVSHPIHIIWMLPDRSSTQLGSIYSLMYT